MTLDIRRPRLKSILGFLISSFKQSKIPVKHILELACGGGRFTIPLAKRGYKITAIDSSKAYLDIHDAFVFSVDKGKIKTGTDKHILKMWERDELKLYLSKTGFAEVMLLDLDTSKKFTAKSRRLGVVAVK
jgi:SAM-dependent methyltransferase